MITDYQELGGEGSKKLLFNEFIVSDMQDEKVLEFVSHQCECT